MSLTRLVYASYMHQKKYMILGVYQLISIGLMILVSHTEDSSYEMMLYPNQYRIYMDALFLQVFLILNAMFVLFLALDHDQTFLKPLYGFFGRLKVLISKYFFFMIIIFLYIIFISMLYIIVPYFLTGLILDFNWMKMSDLFLDMMIILNLILILIKDKHKTLAIVITLIYMLASLFLNDISDFFYYMFPIFQTENMINNIEMSYKICYISLGFTLYLLKSLKEEV